jgi:hypothetical protein
MKIITKINQAVENIKLFNTEVNSILNGETDTAIKTLVDNIPHYRAWYCFYDKPSGRNLFAPSKYIGYYGIDARAYTKYNRKGLDGRQTESILSTWYETISSSHRKHNILSEELREFCMKFSKKPNSLFRINIILKKTPRSTLETNVVDFVWNAYQNLSDENRNQLKVKINKYKPNT